MQVRVKSKMEKSHFDITISNIQWQMTDRNESGEQNLKDT